jgi:hypothetical protein
MLCFAPPVRKVWKMHETGFWQKYKNSPGWLKASAFALVFIVAGLIWAVFSIHNQRREQVIKGVRDMQTVIIRESAGNAQAWYEQRVGMQGADPTVVLNEIFTGFVANNHIPGMSEVWMTTPNDVYLHRDKPFANGSLGMSFNELIAERDAAGGSHSENVLAGVRQGVKGSDWYIVDPQTGKEVVSWLPVWLGGQVYTIGLSAVESNVMAVAGVEEEFKRISFLLSSFPVCSALFSTCCKGRKDAPKLIPNNLRRPSAKSRSN